MYTQEQMLAFGSAISEIVSDRTNSQRMAILLRFMFPDLKTEEIHTMLIEALGPLFSHK
jgi:hypothetical protein